jgi:hypothetical protein
LKQCLFALLEDRTLDLTYSTIQDMTSWNRSNLASDCFNGWENYPNNLDGHKGILPAAPSLNQHLTRLSGQLFSRTEDIWTMGIAGDGMSLPLRAAQFVRARSDDR